MLRKERKTNKLKNMLGSSESFWSSDTIPDPSGSNIPLVRTDRTSIYNTRTPQRVSFTTDIPYFHRIDKCNEEKVCEYERKASELTLPVSYNLKKLFRRVFPFLRWFPRYRLKAWFIGDLLSGISVGLLTIPLSLAFAVCGAQPPINGLYTSLVTTVLYCLLGTTEHQSYGASAFTGLLIAKSLSHNETQELNSDSNCTPTCSRELYVITLTFVSGIILISMGIFRLSFLRTYISKPVINGFKAGTALHLLAILLTLILGIDPSIHHGPLSLIYSCKVIIENINKTHTASVIAGLATLALLVPFKIINSIYSRHLIPIEFIALVASIWLSFWLELEDSHNLRLINNHPFILPRPSLPSFSLISSVVADSVAVALVTFAVSISLGRENSKKHNQSFRPHQETTILGLCDLLLSFLGAFAASGVWEQTVVQEKTWGQTQAASLVAASLCLTALLCADTLLPLVPKAVLGAIVISNLGCYFEFFWKYCFSCKKNKYEFVAGITTFAAVCILDIDIGLGFGILFSILLTLHRLQKPSNAILGHIPNTENYIDLSIEKTAKEVVGIKIIKTFDSIYYGNVDFLLSWIKLKVNCYLQSGQSLGSDEELYSVEDKYHMLQESTQFTALDEHALRRINHTALYRRKISKQTADVHTIILDCGSVSFVDDEGVNALIYLSEQYQRIGVGFILASCSSAVLKSLQEHSYFKSTSQSLNFSSIHDTVLFVLQQTAERNQSLQGSENILETNSEILTECDTVEIQTDTNNSTNAELCQMERGETVSHQRSGSKSKNQRIIEYETAL
ncbi:prestin-like [Carcharodon carcharias]|uniref:prestin-like n=1 Tax=Carcharodon carcharias TaxID=13397 RepID=UPI001B7EE965|nr:prestin-like [Carcharodon carcharias]